jgi:ABC-type transporter Mla subunit MlaD
MRARSSGSLRRAIEWPIDHPWYIVLAAGLVLFTLWAIGTRSQPHHVRAAFSSGFNLVSGLSVDVDGQEVGKISGVHYDNTVSGGGAIVDIGISDNRFWPLHAGTTVESRWGTTIGNGTRRLDLFPGPSNTPALPEGGVIDTKDTLPAVDLDRVLNVFSKSTRGHLTSMLQNMGSGLSGQARGLQNGLASAPPAVDAAAGVLGDLAADTNALSGLVTNGDRLTATLASRAPAISDLVTVTGQTFNALSAHASGIQSTIQSLPPALIDARGTLARLDSSVNVLNVLIGDIAPGAARLSPLAISLRPALAELSQLVPTAVSTLRSATSAAPRITELLNVGVPFMPKVQNVTSALAPMVACMRPYAPELGSAIVSAASWMSTYELVAPHGTPGVTYLGAQQGQFVRQHGVRAAPQASATSLHGYPPGVTTAAFVQATGKQYALPRPPGYGVGQPWFLPECGVTPAALDPAQDPEQRP